MTSFGIKYTGNCAQQKVNFKMIRVSQLEPFALLTLASGLLYAICALTFESEANNCYRIHFIILTLVIFVSLLAISIFKYLKFRFACRQMDDFIMAMKIK